MKTLTKATISTLRDMLECAGGWENNACIIGNITAGEIKDALLEVLKYNIEHCKECGLKLPVHKPDCSHAGSEHRARIV